MLTDTPSRAGVCSVVLIFLKSESFAKSLKKALETGGYRGAAVTTESRALSEAEANAPSLIILDRRSDSSPHSVGVRMLKRFRSSRCRREICPATMKNVLKNMIGISIWSCAARVSVRLVARVRAILRRREVVIESHAQYRVGNLLMDLNCHEVLVNGHAVDLTPQGISDSQAVSRIALPCAFSPGDAQPCLGRRLCARRTRARGPHPFATAED